MKKKLIGLLLLIGVSLILTSCLRTVSTIKEQKVFWGNKEEIKQFLDKPEAQAQRWFLQALGE